MVDVMPDTLAFFVILAFYIFKLKKVDVAIVEVHCGGEFDYTNIIRRPICCGVTPIGLDHCLTLGNSVDKIARNKAGIFKANSFAISAKQPHAVAMAELVKRAAERHCRTLITASVDKTAEHDITSVPCNAQNISLALHLAGAWLHRSDPLETSVKPLVMDGPLRTALNEVRLPARFNEYWHDNVHYFIDSAHTVESVEACCRWFESRVKTSATTTKVLIVSVRGKSREREPLFRLLVPLRFDVVIHTGTYVRCPVPLPVEPHKHAMQLKRCEEDRLRWRRMVDDDDCDDHVVLCAADAVQLCSALAGGGKKSVEVLCCGCARMAPALLSLFLPEAGCTFFD